MRVASWNGCTLFIYYQNETEKSDVKCKIYSMQLFDQL